MGRKGGGSDARRTRGNGQGVDLVRAVARMHQTAQAKSPDHKPRPQAQTTSQDHRPRPPAQTTSQDHKPRPQAQAKIPDHKPRPQAQTTSPDHRPRPQDKARQPRGKEQTKRARAHTRPRPRNLNAPARGSFWRARIILRVRKRKIFLGKGSKNRFPGVGPGHGRGVKNETKYEKTALALKAGRRMRRGAEAGDRERGGWWERGDGRQEQKSTV